MCPSEHCLCLVPQIGICCIFIFIQLELLFDAFAISSLICGLFQSLLRSLIWKCLLDFHIFLLISSWTSLWSNNMFKVLIFKNVFWFVLWPRTRSVWVNVPYAPRRMYIRCCWVGRSVNVRPGQLTDSVAQPSAAWFPPVRGLLRKVFTSPTTAGDLPISLSVCQFLFHVSEVLLLFKIVLYSSGTDLCFYCYVISLFMADNSPRSEVYCVWESVLLSVG